MMLLLGLFTGIIFGFLLQKGRVAKFDVIINAFLLKDFTVIRIMASAVAVGAIGFYTFNRLGLIDPQIKPAELGGIVTGGILFGVGIILYGYCPGTGVAATGEGHRDALVGLFGMLLGALCYVVTFPLSQNLRQSFPDLGKVTLASLTHLPPFILVLGLALIIFIAFRIDRNRRAGKAYE
jgi:uncharacterized protein